MKEVDEEESPQREFHGFYSFTHACFSRDNVIVRIRLTAILKQRPLRLRSVCVRIMSVCSRNP
jgi:hypothetical protein